MIEWQGVENSGFIRALSRRTKQIYDLYHSKAKPSNHKVIDFTFIERVIHLEADLLFELASNYFEFVFDELEPPLTNEYMGSHSYLYIDDKIVWLEVEILYEVCECEYTTKCTSE